jgi:multicomponent Na+:H+ antiporter subunit E
VIVALRIFLSLMFLLIVWLGWSGFLKPLLVSLGIVSCVIVVLLECAHWLRLLPRLPGFWLWLLKEVVKSNLKVARIMLSPRPGSVRRW